MDFKSVATGVLLGGALVLSIQRMSSPSKESILADFAAQIAYKPPQLESSPQLDTKNSDVYAEQFVRNEQFFGEDGQKKIQSSRVIVIGVGGVGSHCAVTLARSGVGYIRLVDFDRVTVSSLNRHASAIRSEVGIPKVTSLKRYIGSFAPECEVDAVEALFNYEAAEELISKYKPDWVIDAIDNIHTKADLLAYCHKNDIKVISACGSAAKCDPTRIRISSVEGTSEDPLARAIRQRLRLSHNLTNTGVPVVYSTERTTRGLLPLKDFQEDNPKEYQTLDKFRIRILPVIAPLPSIMGNAIASYVLCELAEQPFTPQATAPVNSASARKKLWNLSRRLFPSWGPRTADSADAELVLDIVYDACSGRSVISGDARDLRVIPFIFNDERNIRLEDLVLMTKTEAREHIEGTRFPETHRVLSVKTRILRELIENSIVSE
jgi:tRNA A37 threonylcarbamoyladenosine dehydratase